jgi:hypothetical protein
MNANRLGRLSSAVKRGLKAEAIVLFISSLAFTGPTSTAVAAAKPGAGGVYCFRDKGATIIFAQTTLPDHAMKFGLSKWYRDGQNIHLFGVAPYVDGAWRYRSDVDASSPSDRCLATVRSDRRGGFVVTAAPLPNCENNGGFHTEIGTIRIPAASWESKVRGALDGPEEFMNAGKCA